MANRLLDKVKFPAPGRYVLAVSGGVDSMSLLDIMVKHGGYDLIVAHLDHGMRMDSFQDMEMVHEVIVELGLEFIGESHHLGELASEAMARAARYRLLEQVREEYSAVAIITAHHLDDRIETMLLNQQRGADWQGLAPLQETGLIKRPLLNIWKEELYEYARQHNLRWREDSTNLTLNTPRNHLRAELAKHPERKLQLKRELERNDKQRQLREVELERITSEVAQCGGEEVFINRSKFLCLSTTAARDVLLWVLRRYPELEVSRAQILRLEHFIKTARVDKQLPLSGTICACAKRNGIVISTSCILK
ncbi:MAG: tRNA lysidine(34) synthetase TilS [Candidatus Saccharimonadales bacterium]